MKKMIAIGLLLCASSCGEPEKPVKKNIHWTNEQSSGMNKELAIEEDIAIKLYLEQHKGAEVTETGSGLRYMVLRKGSGPLAQPGQDALTQYRVTLLDGTECYKTAEDELDVFRVDRSDIETGIQEGIKKMQAGEKARLIIPSHLAHGLIGDLNKIPPLTTIVVDIELIELQ